jgi:hypothetical protein
MKERFALISNFLVQDIKLKQMGFASSTVKIPAGVTGSVFQI